MADTVTAQSVELRQGEDYARALLNKRDSREVRRIYPPVWMALRLGLHGRHVWFP